MKNKKDLNKRTLSFGINSIFITLVVVCLVGVLNYLVAQYPKKIDLTKNKIHTFSDQSEKVMKGLKSELNAQFFGDMGSKEKYRPVFDNYKKLSNKFKFELIDPNKEPTRAKTLGIKKMDTLLLSYQGKTAKVEDITEEKITNEIIKLSAGSKLVVCTVLGHGEQSFSEAGAAGFQTAKKGLEDQSYEVRELILPQESRIPADCTAVVMMGAVKSLFPAELKMLGDYLDQGGRFVVGMDAALTQLDQTKELRALLANWGVDVKSGLIIDPVSRALGVDASVPIIALFNKEETITKDFKQQCYFPFTRPVEIGTTPIDGLKVDWLAKTTPKSWAETDMGSIAKGEVKFDAGKDLQGPVSAAAVASGKKKGSKATRETRLVVFGSSQFANNQYARFGGNSDLFLNSVSWALEDESLISIRVKEDEAGRVELTQTQGMIIFWISVIIIPLMISIAGIVIWMRRKKM
jgi:ABC-type uncharacterized transport system involved in gliding motility auxiliary subunit